MPSGCWSRRRSSTSHPDSRTITRPNNQAHRCRRAGCAAPARRPSPPRTKEFLYLVQTFYPSRVAGRAASRKLAADMTFIDPRLTERRNPRTADIDLASPLEIVDLINTEDRSVPDAVASQRAEIARAIEEAERTFRRGGRLFYIGAGPSGRLGVLDASEC